MVRVPFRSSKKSVNLFIDSNKPWIKKNLVKYKDFFYKPYEYKHGEIFHFKGSKYSLCIEESTNNFVTIENNNIVLRTYDKNPDNIKKILQVWYRNEAIAFFEDIIPQIQNIFSSLDIEPAGYRYRRMKRKWGSCSSSNLITLNTDLIKANIPAIKYIIVHEFCHLKHFNHGEDFINLLSSVYPEWKEVKKTLDTIPGW